MKDVAKIPTVVLTGFLGSGKTTLLRRWLREELCHDAAVIVQDYSDFGVDAELVAGDDPTPPVGTLVGRVAALHGIHAKELLHQSLGRILNEIGKIQPAVPMLLVESTGAARPLPLWQALTQDSAFSMRHWIVAVDALNLHRDFADGKIFTGENPPPSDPAIADAANLLVEQLLFSSVIILTKTDTLSKVIIDQQIRLLQQIQPHAAIACSARAALSLTQLEPLPAPHPKYIEQAIALVSSPSSPKSPTADFISSIFRDNRPFHPQRLLDVCQSQLATGVYRTKGFIWLASRPDLLLLLQQAGSQVTLELMALWRAGLVAEKNTSILAEERAALLAFLADKDPDFGDRHNELTIIGQPEAVETFSQALLPALCTESEITDWKNGSPFSDPWPTQLIKHL
jgi:G3E family GTPase